MALYNSCARISFSFDLIDHQQQQLPTMVDNTYREAPVSSNFDFFDLSANHNDTTMISADELFFNGRIVPLEERLPKMGTTLRDELIANEDEHEDNNYVHARIDNKGWKQRFGLKRLNGRVVSKKGGKSANIVGDLGSIDEMAC
ncbi:50S ribosomal protein L15 [Striga asiatica]|uniref:50S ribosomal protein L15 n=1 Tax=Striga asiatica TaxID=4170 RepID=A0A5A7P8M6_STRAF|nr:50S ribosomal protein L15 [Striga asiatica]